MRVAPFACGLTILAGCLGATAPPALAPCVSPDYDSLALLQAFFAPGASGWASRAIATDSAQPWDELILARGWEPVLIDRVEVPDGWRSEIASFGPSGDGTEVHRVRLWPGPPVAGADGGFVSVSWSAHEPGRASEAQPLPVPAPCKNGLSWFSSIQNPTPGELAQPGRGAHVLTAGLWENGTLFYTNIPEIDRFEALPRARWYTFDDRGPLQVYVYDQARSERPPHWSLSVDADPLGPAGPWNYTTTIEGFNDVLKGLSSTTSRVVSIPPEKAYTLPGQESHPLYGDSLVFFILVVDVVEFPCPKPSTGLSCLSR